MRMKIVLINLLAVVALLSAGCGETTTETTKKVAQPTTSPTQTQARIPAYYHDAASMGVLPPTLSPDKFIGPAKDAYEVAQEIPNTLAQLPCYCYCDMHMGHKSLHSCFEDTHASQCAVCVSEALQAYQLQQSGVPVEQIRQRIIAEYSKQ
jgi:Protein of unknown function with PCYCGC motif